MNVIEIDGLEQLEADLNRLPQAFDVIHQQYAESLVTGWKSSILDVKAFDTGRYWFSIAAIRMAGGVDAKEFVILPAAAAVFYSDIVERGRTDTDKYPGRFPAGKTLEAQDDANLLEQITTETLNEFLHA